MHDDEDNKLTLPQALAEGVGMLLSLKQAELVREERFEEAQAVTLVLARLMSTGFGEEYATKLLDSVTDGLYSKMRAAEDVDESEAN